ncbi:MFS transporter [Kribbella sandramycini]|uniref:MFS family permease n=1 Tax=Kribbella sandramycini TaxID=60450 RepID=A0A7Y4KXU9_9ACTN|nr:MFS transporter [Kribbella sandramycini]MBB6567743.1 MFS family permease [Kribbella sandramycini]NOL39661.1 MFS transporter [Kribbella sandramycini]
MSRALVEPAQATAPLKSGAVVAILAFGGIVVSFMQSLVTPLIPVLPQLFDAKPSATAWMITATLLAAAVVVPAAGRLGDMYGKRRMLLLSLAVLVAGSVLAALSSSLELVLVGRAMQGLASGVIPLGIAIMRDVLPADKVGSATAQMSASLAAGGAIGVPIAAFIADNADWPVLFWTAAGLGAVTLTLTLCFVPESDLRTGGRFDLGGAIALSAGVSALLLAISLGSDWGWTSARTLLLLAAGFVLLIGWGWYERKVDEPLVDLRTLARPPVLLTNIASLVFGFSILGMGVGMPTLLQLPEATGYGLGQSMLMAGLIIGPTGLALMAAAPLSAVLSKAKGPKVTLMLGSAVVAVGYLLSLVMISTVWQVIVISVVVGAGIGLAYGALPALLNSSVPVSETAAANGLNALMRSAGTAISGAVTGVVLAQWTTDFNGTPLSSERGFQLVFAIGAAAALTSLVVAYFIPASRNESRPLAGG